MSRDYCMRCYGNDDGRYEYDENRLCPKCDRVQILEIAMNEAIGRIKALEDRMPVEE